MTRTIHSVGGVVGHRTGLRSKYFHCSGRCLGGGRGWSSGLFRRPERALAPVSGYRQ